jgi:ATP-binding cassette, subfamily B, bacterial
MLLALDALAIPVALLMPLPLKIVVDNVLGSHPLPDLVNRIVPAWVIASTVATLWLVIILVLLVALLGLIQRFASWIYREYLGEKILLEFRGSLFEHVTRLSLAQHDMRGVTDLTYRIQYDAPAIRWLVMDGALPLITAVLTLIGMIYVITRINLRLAMIALIIIPAIFLLTQIYGRRLRENWSRVKTLETDALSVVQEVLGAMRVVTAFGQERREQKRFFEISRQSIREHIRVIIAESQFSLLVGVTAAVGTATVLFLSAEAVQAGQMTTGELLLVMAYLAQLYEPLELIGNQVAAQQASLASAERAFSVFDESPAIVDIPNAISLARARGDIAFADVVFAYDNRHAVLQHVSFQVSAGTTVGIIGKTGAGKTTLVSLLARFYDPTEGTIFMDGVDLRKYRIADLRKQFAIVLQEPVLFPTTIAENIAYGTPGADRHAIVAAAKAANADDFITALPQGYDTVVGDRGATLSGGERQRVSLARAFIKNSPMLILDEPTSSVDIVTEAAILEATLRLMAERTTFVIAHRLSTLRHCGLLLVLDGGHLIRATNSPEVVLRELLLDGKGEWKERESVASLERHGTI